MAKVQWVMEFFPSILHVRQICKTLKYVSYGAALGRASRGSIGWIFHGSNCATDHYCGISHSGNLYFSAYFLTFSTYFPRGCTLVVLQPSSGTKISNNREESNNLLARLAVRSVVDFAFCKYINMIQNLNLKKNWTLFQEQCSNFLEVGIRAEPGPAGH